MNRKIFTSFLVFILSIHLLYRQISKLIAVIVKDESEVNTRVKQESNQKFNPIIGKLKDQYPNCFSEHLFDKRKVGENILHLSQVLQYKLLGKNMTTSVRYNHQCPYMLKDRYNCARNDSDILNYGNNPTDWKLNLMTGKKGAACPLWDFIHKVGGPVGVAKALETHEKTSKKKRKKRPFIVLMMGNSYLRQVFEALSCGWSNDISEYRASIGSKACYSVNCTTKNGERIFRVKQVGKLLPLSESPLESNYSSTQQFYRAGVSLPTTMYPKNVTDDLAMVEFGKRIRFYFVFRPYQLASLHNIAEKVLHLDFANIDKLVVDSGSFKYILQGNQQVRKKFQTNGVLRKKSIYSHKLLQDIQRRDVGRWFGADNPYIWTPPSGITFLISHHK